MIWKRWGTHGPIGVDVGARTITAVQIARTGRAWRVGAAAALDRAGVAGSISAPDVARLADVLYRQGFAGRELVLAVPDEKLLSTPLELPPRSSGAPLEQLAGMEVARTHKRDAASLEVAVWDLPNPARAGESSHVMTAACVHADAESLLDQFDAAGLTVSALDTRAWALARACRAQLEDTGGIGIVLDLSEGGALLAAVHSGVVVYDRLIRDGGLDRLRGTLCAEMELTAEVADYLLGGAAQRPQVDHPEDGIGVLDKAKAIVDAHAAAIAEEARASFAYASHRYPDAPLARLLVVGRGSSVPGLASSIGAALEVETRAITPADLAPWPSHLDVLSKDPALVAALGLARHEGGDA